MPKFLSWGPYDDWKGWLRGLVIAERQVRGAQAGSHGAAPRWYLAVQRLVARLSRGRLTNAHEEVLYVMRKPEYRYARLL